jgi:LytS/YehU family sensor histidine kinase
VENSFKHGLKSGAENPFVKIKIDVLPNDLIFEIENSKGKSIRNKRFKIQWNWDRKCKKTPRFNLSQSAFVKHF